MSLRYWLSDVFRAPAGDEDSSSGGAAEDDWKAPFVAAINERVAAAADADEVVEPKKPVAANTEQEETDETPDAAVVESDETLLGDAKPVPKSDEPEAPVVDEARGEILALAKSYGLGEEETKSFATRVELEKALELLDQHLLRTGVAVIQSQAQRQALLNQPVEQPPKAEAPAVPVVPVDNPVVGGDEIAAYVTKLKELGYDKEVVAPIEMLLARMQLIEGDRDASVREKQTFRQRAIEHSQMQEQAIFVSALDGLADEDLFGTKAKSSDDQRANVAKLFQTVHTLRSGLYATGRNPTLTEDLVSRAYRATFEKTIVHRGRVEKSKALIEQGKSRMGSSTRSPSPPKKTAHVNSGGEVHPEIAKWWSENVTNPTAS